MSGTALRSEELQGVDRIWHLRQAVLLKGLSVPDLAAIAQICSDRIYSKDEVIFSQDDVADAIFILNRGCVRISVVNPMGREKIVGLFKTGDLFGEIFSPFRKMKSPGPASSTQLWAAKSNSQAREPSPRSRRLRKKRTWIQAVV